MKRAKAPTSRETLLRVATERIRRDGVAGTSVDDICREAGVTKGAFFHHFPGKEALVEECLRGWDAAIEAMVASAGFLDREDPVDRVLGYLDHFIGMLEAPGTLKSCLAGTTVQEVSESHPRLRDAANACFVHAGDRLVGLLEDAARSRGVRVDAAALATLWMAAMQGALVLFKASRDAAVLGRAAREVRAHIAHRLGAGGAASAAGGRARKADQGPAGGRRAGRAKATRERRAGR